MNRRYLLSFTIGLFACFTAFLADPDISQAQKLSGTISAPDNQPVENAEVFIVELKKGTVTDANGHFDFHNLPSGTFTLSVSHIGFQSATQAVKIGGKPDTELSLQLTERIFKNNPLLVTGSRARESSQTPLNTLVISSEELTTDAQPTLWDLIEKEPGVALETNGPGIQRPVIRGLSTNRIKVLNRGTEYHYQKWDPESGLSMNGNSSEQVEIIKGPTSLMYGSGAMGGVVSLAEDRPAPRGKTVGSYQLGLFSNTYGVNNKLALKGGEENYFWGFSGSFDSHADYETGDKRVIRNSRYNNLQLQANTGLTRSWGTSRLTYEYLQHKNGIVEDEEEEPGMGAEEEEEKGREIERPYHNLVNHALTSETDWYRDDTHLNLTLALQSNQQQEFEPAENEAAMDLMLNSFNYRASIDQEIAPDFEINTGIHGNLKENESEGEETFVPSADYANLGFFAIADWQTSESLTIEGGARYDLHNLETREPQKGKSGEHFFGIPQEVNREFNHASGSLGFSFYPSESLTFKSNVGIGYRTPNIAELTADGALREIRRYEVGDNSLSPESNIEADASLEYLSTNFSISAGGFYNAIDNYIYQEQNGVIAVGPPASVKIYPVFYYRQHRAALYGGEAGFAIHPETAQWITFNSEFSFVVGQNEEQDEPLPMIPAPSIDNTITLRKQEWGPLQNTRFSLSLRKFFDQDRTASFEEETPGYWLTDVSIGSDIPMGGTQLQLTLSVHNLLNVDYVSHLSLLKYDEIHNRGRNISLTARIPFNL